MFFNPIKTSDDRDLRMLFGKNSKIVEETETICVPIKAQLSDYHTKTGGMKRIPRSKWV